MPGALFVRYGFVDTADERTGSISHRCTHTLPVLQMTARRVLNQ